MNVGILLLEEKRVFLESSASQQCLLVIMVALGFPGGSVVENLPANAEDTGSVPGLGRSPGEGNGNPLQTSGLRIPCVEEPDGLQSMKSQSQTHVSN